jgi:hypothetical protein
MRRKLTAMALAIGVITVFAGSALAGHLAGGVTSYTGCLVSKDGVIIKIKAGESPSSPCSGGMVQVHFSGGDITTITAGTGLQGGGTNGAVTLSLAAGFQLPQGCATEEIAKWSGSTWECAQDSNSTYVDGIGLDLTGNVFSIDEPYRLPAASQGDSIIKGSGDAWTTEQFTRAGESCPSGQFVRATSSGGGVTCATPASSSNAWVQSSGTPGGVPDDGDLHPFAALNPGGGTYLIIAKANIGSQQNVDQFRNVRCVLAVDGVVYDEAFLEDDILNEETRLPVHLTTVATVGTGFSLQCRAGDGADGITIGEIKLIGVRL